MTALTVNRWIYGSVVGFACGLATLFFGFSIVKDGYLASDMAILIFPILLEMNATLIGLWSIVFVYYARTLNEDRVHWHTLAAEVIEKLEKLMLSKDKLSTEEKMLRKAWFENVETSLEHMEDVSNKLKDFTRFGAIVIASFLSSILFSMLSLGRMEKSGIGIPWIFFSLLPFMLGVAFIVVGILSTIPKKPEKPIPPQ